MIPGLDRDQRRQIAALFAATGPGGTIPGVHVAAFSGQYGPSARITINGGLHLHGIQDVNALETQLTKRAKGRPHVRRGARG
jgi:hypothetical protein